MKSGLAASASLWVVERTLAWLHGFRRLAMRYLTLLCHLRSGGFRWKETIMRNNRRLLMT